MKCIEGWPVDDGRLVANEHTLGILKGVDDHCTCVAQAYLEDGMVIAAPPALTYGSVVVAEFGEMADNWEGAGDFWNAFDYGNVGGR